jgi:hypothetical protein
LILTNASSLYVYAATNGSPPWQGAWVSTGGDMVVAPGCWVYPYSDGRTGSVARFSVGANVWIATNAGFNADQRGYDGSPPGFNGKGYGPGGGWSRTSSARGGGAGYGGAGGPGSYSGCAGGVAYGDSNAPAWPGSGGGGGIDVSYGGKGGGAIWIEAPQGSVTLQGTLTADGQAGGTQYDAGGGSGGGIYITCWTFKGHSTAALRARGGRGASRYVAPNWLAGGCGGGGRIAVWRIADRSAGAVACSVDSITNVVPACAGQRGTIVWGQLPPPGSVFLIR